MAREAVTGVEAWGAKRELRGAERERENEKGVVSGRRAEEGLSSLLTVFPEQLRQ